jgi:hypothetical protein
VKKFRGSTADQASPIVISAVHSSPFPEGQHGGINTTDTGMALDVGGPPILSPGMRAAIAQRQRSAAERMTCMIKVSSKPQPERRCAVVDYGEVLVAESNNLPA